MKYRRILPLLFSLVFAQQGFAQSAGHTASAAQKQPEKTAHLVRLRVSPAAIEQLRSAFAPSAAALEKKGLNAQTLYLTDEETIRTILDIPSTVTGLVLKPFIANHTVVFEELRERSNPQLFRNSMSIAPAPASDISLKDAEEKLSRWFELQYSNDLDPSAVAAMIKHSGAVELAEPKFVRRPAYTPNDTLVDQQYSLKIMKVLDAWDLFRCDSTMIVADVDVGTDWSHIDLVNAVHINAGETGIDNNGVDKRLNGVDDDNNGFVDDWHGWDFDGPDGSAPDNDTRSTNDHGTHTAGILAASGDNKYGIAGVAFGAKLIPVKASDNVGATLDFGFEGIAYAADMGAKVISCSWGGSSRSQAEQDVVNYAYGKDAMVVAASGNDGIRENFYPASYDHVLSVASIGFGGNLSGFGNSGTRVDVTAPGENILSTLPGNNYGNETGTSMACPNAAGALALVRQFFPGYSAGQAAERLRVTADSVVGNNGYYGHGRVNVLRALKDKHAYSARIESAQISDDLGNGVLTANESGSILLSVRNYLDAVHDLRAKIEIVEGGEHVSTATSILAFGTANTLSLVQNLQGSFRVHADDSTLPNTEVTVRVTFYDSTLSYADDIDYFSFVVNPDYSDLHKNNLTVTIDSKGGIGYNDPPSNTQGSGFIWTNAPSAIAPEGKSLLYDGGLMIGAAPDRIVSIAPSMWSGNSTDMDFAPVERVHSVMHPLEAGVQELQTIFADSLADPSRQVGVTVRENAYAFNTALAKDAVVINYTLKKHPSYIELLPTDTTSIALYMDWDVGIGGGANHAYLASDSVTAVVHRLDNSNYPYVGMRVISPLPKGASVQYYAINNDGSQGSVGIYDGFLPDEKWQTLRTPRTEAGIKDISEVYGIRNAPLLSEDSVVLTYVIGVAADAATLNSVLDAAAASYKQLIPVDAVQLQGSVAPGIHVYPNPFNDRLQINWSAPQQDRNEPASVVLFDALGRKVFSTITSSMMASLNHLQLPTGFYTLRIDQGSTHLTERISHLR